MENQPQNPEFRINPENFHPCAYIQKHFRQFFHGIKQYEP